jgi:hypothetical protein
VYLYSNSLGHQASTHSKLTFARLRLKNWNIMHKINFKPFKTKIDSFPLPLDDYNVIEK